MADYLLSRPEVDPDRVWWFRLAGLLGCSVEEAQDRIDAREFREWIVSFQTQPWGEAAADARAVATTATIVRALGVKRMRAEWVLPWVGAASPTMTPAMKGAALRAAAGSSGVRFVTRPRAPGEGK